MEYSKILQRVSLFIIIVLLSFLLSCNKENRFDCIKSTGKIINSERQLNDFKELEIDDVFNVFITQDTINKIIIEGGENLLPLIITEVKDKKLFIKNNNKCNWVRSYKKELNIFLYTQSLEHIILYGESKIISIDTLDIEVFTIDNWSRASKIELTINCSSSHLNIHGGTGSYTLRGRSGVSYIYSSGTGHVFADNLKTGYTYITNNSTGDCHIYVTKELGFKILRSGNIYYSGEPYKIDTIEVSGSGKLIKQ